MISTAGTKCVKQIPITSLDFRWAAYFALTPLPLETHLNS